MTSTKFWYLLVDFAAGQPYKGTSSTSVKLPPDADVDDFRKLVHLENSSILTGIAPSQLLVFKNKAAFDTRNNAEDEGKKQPLDPPQSISMLGSIEDMLVVVVPPSNTYRGSVGSPFAQGKPSEERKKRWIQLNEILEGNAKKSKTNDSTAYSYVTWNQVKSIFSPESQNLPTRAMDDAQLDFLAKYLSFASQCLGAVASGKEAKRLHFIAPVLICVCSIFEGEVNIKIEEDLVGNFIKAHGHFEFMLTRGNKAICIVEAKRDDLEQGMAQDLIGCEVAAEVGGLDVVYGIVTNFVQWNFLCSRNDKIEMDICTLGLQGNLLDMHSLKIITEKIHSMLSD